MSEGGSMRSLSGKVLWFWVFLLISCPLLVWTTGWIRSKKRSGPWKDHEATAPVLILTEAWEKMRIWQQRHIIFCKKQKMQNTFLHMFYSFLHIFTHFYTCVSGFFLTYTFLHILTHPYTSIRIQVYCSLFGSCFRTVTSYDMLFNPSKWLRSNGLHIFLHFLQWTYAW